MIMLLTIYLQNSSSFSTISLLIGSLIKTLEIINNDESKNLKGEEAISKEGYYLSKTA